MFSYSSIYFGLPWNWITQLWRSASHQSLMLLAHSVAVWTVESTETFLTPSACVCISACTMLVYGWRWGCGVSDDTGSVIPPTSASNLQHEKDTLVTLYLPPTILYPHLAPSAWRFSLSLIWTQIKQRIRLRNVSTTTCNQTYKRGSIYSFLVLSPMPPLVRNFTQYRSNYMFSSVCLFLFFFSFFCCY